MRSTIVRAYDLGGFGDIAGAMRVASHLQRTGVPTKIKTKSKGAMQKLKILKPDVDYSFSEKPSKGVIEVDVAGHYKDDRNKDDSDVPHHYTEDMDNPSTRKQVVPIYLKTGLTEKEARVPGRVFGQAPMFYRPYREWDLPKVNERDPRKQIIDAILPDSMTLFLLGRNLNRLENTLDQIGSFGFAHLSPAIQSIHPAEILEHPYFFAVHKAALNTEKNYAVGLFVGPEMERGLSIFALEKYWNVIRSNGHIQKFDKDLPTLIFLGPQQQTTTTGLFLSANMPNLVTGDLSLSDAMYALLAMEGQGFFYETPGWKAPTFNELSRMLGRYNKTLSQLFFLGSNLFEIKPEERARYFRELEYVANIFADPTLTEQYRDEMKLALTDEIKRRFGETVKVNKEGDFYIPAGAPYLIEDATAKVVEMLQDDSTLLATAEKARHAIRNGLPVTVDVRGVLQAEPISNKAIPGFTYKNLYLDSYDIPKYYSDPYGENKLENIINYPYSSFKNTDIYSLKEIKKPHKNITDYYKEELIYKFIKETTK